MKIKRVFLMSLVLATAFCSTALAATYTDIAGHRDEAYILEYSQKGYISGYPDGTFRPDETITRAEAATLLKKLELPEVNQKAVTFSDVHSTDWYYDAVHLAVKSNMVSGYEDNTFRPQNNITRFEAINILSKLVRSENYNDVQLPYGDKESIPSWVNTSVRNLYAAGIIAEYDGNQIAGNTPVTRGEIVRMLDKIMVRYGFDNSKVTQNASKSYTEPIAKTVSIPHDTLGYLTISSIGINKFPVKDGADLATIRTAIGHFSETPLWDGNVGFCAHNRDYKYDFRNLKKIERGDEVVYETRFGKRIYQVTTIKPISETDWSDIVTGSDVNKLTMVTCIESQPTQRLLVQAVQK